MAASTSKTPETTPAQSTLPPASTSTPVLSSTLPPPTTPCVKKTGSPNIFLPAEPSNGLELISNIPGATDTIGQTLIPTADLTITSFSFDLRFPGGNSPALLFAAIFKIYVTMGQCG
ncbi:hypothetical protein WJX75_002795 [Coccomyxa subellipsoidea]|uniref:Pherophorin domain-containing protein n=1 Tax=Coccomyxa subellipsoidea TaxID=248742 RepID=A0ABR2YIF4_9CHLO